MSAEDRTSRAWVLWTDDTVRVVLFEGVAGKPHHVETQSMRGDKWAPVLAVTRQDRIRDRALLDLAQRLKLAPRWLDLAPPVVGK